MLRKINNLVGRLVTRIRQISRQILHRFGVPVASFTQRSYRKAHHHAAHRPHIWLTGRFAWYKRWHEHRLHPHVHYGTLAVYLVLVVGFVFYSIKPAFAGDLNDTFDFTTPGNYTFDSGVEASGTTARLKANNYTSDANTAALYHLDEASGTNADDSSSNNNDGTTVNNPTFGTGNLNNGLSLSGTNQYVSTPDSASLSVTGNHTIEAWTKFSSTFNTDATSEQGIFDKGSQKLSYNNDTGKIAYEIANSGSTTWTKQLGPDMTGNFANPGLKTTVRDSVSYGSDIIVGTGASVGDAEVWQYSSGSWSKIGGDGIRSSWADNTYEDVWSLAVNGTALYAGLGTDAAGDGEVWTCDMSTSCTSWTKIGGDGLGLTASTYESVPTLEVSNGVLYAGGGHSTAGDADVWRYDGGTSWTKIGGDSVNSSWAASHGAITAMTTDGTNLYIAIGGIGGSQVYRWNGSSWTDLAGSGNIGITSLYYQGGYLWAGTGMFLNSGFSQYPVLYRYSGGSWTVMANAGVCQVWCNGALQIQSITGDGTNIYVSLGTMPSIGGNFGYNGIVFKYDGVSTWSIIAGENANSWDGNTWGVPTLLWHNSKLWAGTFRTYGDNGFFEYSGSSNVWTQRGGYWVNKSWAPVTVNEVSSSTTHGDKIYFGTGSTTYSNATVWEYDGTTSQIIGGSGINSSWATMAYEKVSSLISYKGALYAGIGTDASEGEVWRWNGSTWSKIGGDGTGWTGHQNVTSLAVYNGKMYAGLGIGANNAEVWEYNGSTWTKVGGDGTNSSWTSSPQDVQSMTAFDNKLCVGLGQSGATGADVWCWAGSGSWSRIGYGGLAGAWGSNAREVNSLVAYRNKLIAGVGENTSTSKAELWEYNGSSWTKIAGASTGSSWADGTYERVASMAVYNGELFAGTGYSTGDGDVWKYNGSTWSQVGGDALNSSWAGSLIESVVSMTTYKGKLYATTGNSNADALVYTYGNNGYLESSVTTQDTNWHHIAATYNGSTMEIFVDGLSNASTSASVTQPDNALPLLVGTTYGSKGAGRGQGYFTGSLDEIRYSNIARSSFNNTPYPSSEQAVALTNEVHASGVATWDGLSSSETTNGGTITYRLSDDGGTTWKYWSGSAWSVSGGLTQANAIAVVNSNISTFPVGYGGITWQAVLKGNGNQRVTLNSVSLSANSDLVDPSANATNIQAYKSNGGASLSSGSWTNGGSPYFTWTAGSDAGSGIRGYCLYLGTTSSGDPAVSKGMLGTNPLDTNGGCQFAVSSTNLDLATSGYLGTALTTSNSDYYLNIKAIDVAGNISDNSTQFAFKFDNTPPVNPLYITAPSGFVSNRGVTLTWPTVGSDAPSDANSGLAGLQYRINSNGWYGDTHSGTGDINDLLTNDGSYTMQDDPKTDFDNLNEGINTVYFRTWDQAGNVISTYTTAIVKINSVGAPSEPQNVSATPSTNTANSFAFSWDAPATFIGDVNMIDYCYTVNTLPSVGTCSWVEDGTTSLGANAYATQPGSNTFYVAARSEAGLINYSSYSTTTFTANTTAPGIPTNMDAIDVSIKDLSNWRIALTWAQPTSVGSGVASYKIYRSTNNVTFTNIGSSASTSYIDSGLSQVVYYYKVTACDSANNCGAYGTTVSEYPDGKFTEAALIVSEPAVSDVTTKRATIRWSTDRNSDSKVAIGTTSGSYSESEIGNSSQVTSHEIKLDNLAAGTTYYFVAKWTDGDGNTGTSQEYTFTTSPAPVLKEVQTTKVNLSGANIQFTTKDATKATINYGRTDSLGGVKSINTSLSESTYNIELPGLDDGAKYLYRITLEDSEGGTYPSSIFSFTTPERPRIENLQFQPIEGEPSSTQQVTWTTNVPTNSTVTYGKDGTGGVDIQFPDLKTEHEIVIRGLEDDSSYFLIAQGRDNAGNLAVSDRQTFKTALDTRPPKITNIVVEPTIRDTGADARGQVIVTWTTDEPSTSQVEYGTGSTATEFNTKTTTDTEPSTEHIVIVSDLPTSSVYSIRPVAQDKSGNTVYGESQPVIIGRASDDVLNIVLNTLRKVFRF